MLPKAQKLNSKSVTILKKEGKRVKSTLFSVLYKKEKENKFAVTVPKKTYKNAVDRNTAKRKVFAIIRQLSPVSIGHYSFVVYGKINELPFLDIKGDLEKILCQKY